MTSMTIRQAVHVLTQEAVRALSAIECDSKDIEVRLSQPMRVLQLAVEAHEAKLAWLAAINAGQINNPDIGDGYWKRWSDAEKALTDAENGGEQSSPPPTPPPSEDRFVPPAETVYGC